MLQRFSGASVKRVIDRSFAHVPEHAHDWPVLSIFVIGGYLNQTELGESFIAGPSAIFYRARAAHQNMIASAGFEQIEIEFDPAWLGESLLPNAPVSRWLGGRAGAEARMLARVCGQETTEERVRVAMQQFVERANHEVDRLHNFGGICFCRFVIDRSGFRGDADVRRLYALRPLEGASHSDFTRRAAHTFHRNDNALQIVRSIRDDCWRRPREDITADVHRREAQHNRGCEKQCEKSGTRKGVWVRAPPPVASIIQGKSSQIRISCPRANYRL